MEAVINTLIQFSVFIGSIYIVGFIISLINKAFYKMTNYSNAIIYGTGIIGTPIHELSHALFCIIFLHKIVEIKLFKVSSDDGTLGYVKHSYNKKNIWHIIGNFFIGVAPIICGTLVLILLLWLMVPNTYNQIVLTLNSFNLNNISIGSFFNLFGKVIFAFFGGYTNWLWWLYLIPCLCIALHMNFSAPDFKGSLVSLPIILILLLVVNLILFFVSKNAYSIYVNGFWKITIGLIVILIISLLFSLLTLVFGFIVYSIRKVARRG